MNLTVSCELIFDIKAPSSFILSVMPFNNVYQQLQNEGHFQEDGLFCEETILGANQNRILKLHNAQKGRFTFWYTANIILERKAISMVTVSDTAIHELPAEVVPYLFPSRYCPCDQLYSTAHALFGHLPTNSEKVAAIEAWIFHQVKYTPGSTNESSSAIDVIQSKEGVCRDFAHIGISFCRALDIPARYISCYAYGLVQRDFHAYFQAYIGSEWVSFDATRLAPVEGFVDIAIGADAAEVAFCNFFGNVVPLSVDVHCDLYSPAPASVS